MKILVAEDDQTSRNILSALLHKHGHDVQMTRDGREAWQAMQEPEAPRVVVLDWMMPKIDGLEVCRRIRKQSNDSYRYVIMQTAKGQRQDVHAGFEAGADDYLVKPLDTNQLQHRLRVAERVIAYEEELQQTKQELDQYAHDMENLAEQRAQQLIRADRMATLGTLSAGIAHEINNPTSFIAGNAQSLERAWDRIQPHLESLDLPPQQAKQVDFVLEELPDMLKGIKKGVTRITEIVNGLKNYVHQGCNDASPKEAFSLSDAIAEALDLCHNELKYNVDVQTQLPTTDIRVVGNKQEVEQVFVNLFTNAAHAMSQKGAGELSISATPTDQMIQINVQDNGPGMDKETLDRAFDPFYTTKTQGQGTGLGLSISKGIVEDHGGKLEANNRPDGGAVFTFSLPLTDTTTKTPDTEID